MNLSRMLKNLYRTKVIELYELLQHNVAVYNVYNI